MHVHRIGLEIGCTYICIYMYIYICSRDSPAKLRGMVVGYAHRWFTIKFVEPNIESIRAQWGQLRGDTPWPEPGSPWYLELQLATTLAPLVEPPRGRIPAAADCWDMRRGEFVDKTGPERGFGLMVQDPHGHRRGRGHKRAFVVFCADA